jgi:V8-like Glu-specific endopeptidase
MNRKQPHARLSVLAATLALSGTAVIANDAVISVNNPAPTLSPEEILKAKPLSNTLPKPDTSNAVAESGPFPFTQGLMTREGPQYFDAGARAFGAFGIPYTTTRVQEGNMSAAGWTSANRLSTTYPYRTVGKLTFRVGTGTSWCSASVIRRGVIVTAAHCIQRFGSGSTTYSNWQFTPGHYGAAGATPAQIAPYGTWAARAYVRPSSWANGTDTGCGSARNNDLAVIAIAKNAQGRFIGDIVGGMSYGWNNYSFVTSPKTGNLHTAAVSTLGYPGLMDSGRIMQRTDGPTYTTTVCNAKQLWQGSNLTGGSSGGPWVVNFSGANASLSGNAVVGTAPTMAVIGVTSWGSSDPNVPKDNYSSQFAQNAQYPNANYGNRGAGNIGSLLNTLCSAAAPGGGTYASQGYCN